MPIFFEMIFLVHVRQHPISVVTPKHSSQAWPQKKHPNSEATPKHKQIPISIMEIWKYPRLLHSPNPAFHKGGIFFKNCCNRGWEIFTGNRGEPGMGGWVYNWGWEVYLHSWQRGANSPLLWRLPCIYLLSIMSFLFRNYSLVKIIYLLIRC